MNTPRPTWLVWLSMVLLIAVVYVMARPEQALPFVAAPLPTEFKVEKKSLADLAAAKVRVAKLAESEFVFQSAAIIRPPSRKVKFQSLDLNLRNVKYYTLEYTEKRTGARIEICGLVTNKTNDERPLRYLASLRGLPEDLPLVFSPHGLVMLRSDDRLLQYSGYDLLK